MAIRGKSAIKTLVVTQDVLIDDSSWLGVKRTAYVTIKLETNDATSDGDDHSAYGPVTVPAAVPSSAPLNTQAATLAAPAMAPKVLSVLTLSI